MIAVALEARILVVEDDAIVAHDIEDSLHASGYSVVAVAPDGEEAVELAAQLKPDLVVMDIRLPGTLDGIAAAENIREELDIPVVYLTAHSDRSTLERAKHAGSWGYLVKPFDASGLRAAVEVALHRHQADQLLRESEERFRATLDAIPEGILATDAGGRITFVNPGAEFLLARSAPDMVGRAASTVVCLVTEEGHILQDPVEAALRERGTVFLTGRTSLRLPGERTFPVRGSVAIMRDADGQRLGAVMALHDTRVATETERRLREREARFREIATGGPWASFVVDDIGTLRTCTDAFCRLAGVEDPSQAEGRVMEAFILGLVPFAELAGRVQAAGMAVSTEHYLRQAGGETLPVLLTLQPDPEDPSWFFGRVVDITRAQI